jgi:hypothetical protein
MAARSTPLILMFLTRAALSLRAATHTARATDADEADTDSDAADDRDMEGEVVQVIKAG